MHIQPLRIATHQYITFPSLYMINFCKYVYTVYTYVTVSAKTDHVCTKTEIHLLHKIIVTLKKYLVVNVYTQCLVTNVNESAFLEGPCSVTTKRMALIEATNWVGMT